MINVLNSIKSMFSSMVAYLSMSDDERYLSKAVDHVDLERRIKKLENKTTLFHLTGAR